MVNLIIPVNWANLAVVFAEFIFVVVCIGSAIHLASRVNTKANEDVQPKDSTVVRLSMLSMSFYAVYVLVSLVATVVGYANQTSARFCQVIVVGSAVLAMIAKNSMYSLFIWIVRQAFANTVYEFSGGCTKGILVYICFNTLILSSLQALYWPQAIYSTGHECEQTGWDTVLTVIIGVYLLSDIAISAGSCLAFLCRMKLLFKMSGQEDLREVATKVTTLTLLATTSTFVFTIAAFITDLFVLVRLDMMINCLCIYFVFRATEDNYKRCCFCCHKTLQKCVVNFCCDLCICCWFVESQELPVEIQNDNSNQFSRVNSSTTTVSIGSSTSLTSTRSESKLGSRLSVPGASDRLDSMSKSDVELSVGQK